MDSEKIQELEARLRKMMQDCQQAPDDEGISSSRKNVVRVIRRRKGVPDKHIE